MPIGLAALAAGIKHLPDGPPATPHARLDMLSVALAAAAGFALVYPLIEGRQDGWPAWSFAVLVAGVAIVGAFALRQSARVRGGHAALVVPRSSGVAATSPASSSRSASSAGWVA